MADSSPVKPLSGVLDIRLFLWLIIAIIIIPANGSAGLFNREKPLARGEQMISITFGGLERQYLVHLPKGYEKIRPAPVVIMFHGAGGNARTTLKETGLAAAADKEGFIAVFPEGTAEDPSKPPRFKGNPQTWNDGSYRENVPATIKGIDDVGFVGAMLDDLTRRFGVDRRRIYAAGFSNGSSMAFRVGRELSARIAAIASASGSDWLDRPAVSRPVSMLYITGTADKLNPIDGGEQRLMGRKVGVKPSVASQISKWARMLGCPESPRVIHEKDGVRGVAYGPCRGGAEVVYYTVEGMGHTWAGGNSTLPKWMVGATSDKINANDIMWEFFRKHPME